MNKAFEKIVNRFKQLQGCDSLANMFISDVIKVIKSIEKEYNNGWIPCSERLPETFEPIAKAYLTTNEDGMIGVSYYHHGWSNGYESVFDVIAWQPLPEPYEEETEDE